MAKYLTLLSLFVFIGCASSKNESEVKDKKAKIYYGQGTQDLYLRDYTKALNNLLMANELNPNDSKVKNNLGMAYYFKKDTQTAIKFVREAIELDPKNTDAKINLATIDLQSGNLDAAKATYETILKDLTYEAQFKTHYNLGIIYLKKNETENAQKQFLKSVEAFDSYCPSHYQLGKIYFQKRDFEKAYKSFYSSGIGQCYNSPEPHYMQGLTLIQLERFEDAKVKFETIMGRFDNSDYASKARRKLISITHLLDTDSKSEFSVKSKIKKKLMSTDF